MTPNNNKEGELLRILMVEDNPHDARLLKRELERMGPEVRVDVVATPDELRAALRDGAHDLILSDYDLGGWNGLDALLLSQTHSASRPFILVTGSLGDEKAAECVRMGVSDFVLKDRLTRLPTAIHRALKEKTLKEERLAAIEALRHSEANLRSLVEHAPYAIYKTSLEGGRILSANPALVEMLGYESEAELQALDLPTQVYRDSDARARLLSQVGQEERFQNLEVEWQRKDGKPLLLRTSGRVVREENGERSIEAIAEDITERRSLEDQLRQAQKMEAIGQLAGGVAHDFNNLLGVVLGYSELLLESVPASDPARRKIEQIQEAARRGTAVTRQLLAFSRKQVMEPRILRLGDVVSAMQEMLQRLLGESIELFLSCDPELKTVKADPGQVEQVIMNLAINARDAMPSGGKLVIEARNVLLDQEYSRRHAGSQPGPFVMLAVSDTGTGMDELTRAHIFEPFFTTKPKGKGTGLGLATVYGIVKQSGGYIGVYSELGRGTTFKVYLPPAEKSRRPSAAPEAAVVLPRGTETVLVVEDENMLRQVTCEYLETSGYRILRAANGAEALRLTQSYPDAIHLMVTDVVMPGMSGRELAENLRRSRPETKVLYVSGYADDAMLQRDDLEPGAAFLEKPFTRALLVRKVREVLEGSGVRSQ